MQVAPARFLFSDNLGGARIDDGYKRENSIFANLSPFQRVVAGSELNAGFLEFLNSRGEFVAVREQHVEAAAVAHNLDFDRFGPEGFLQVLDVVESESVRCGSRSVEFDHDSVLGLGHCAGK